MSIILQFLLCCLADGLTKEKKKRTTKIKALKITMNHFGASHFHFCFWRSIEFMSSNFFSSFSLSSVFYCHWNYCLSFQLVKNDINKFHFKSTRWILIACVLFVLVLLGFLLFHSFISIMHAVAEVYSKMFISYYTHFKSIPLIWSNRP